MADAVSHDQNFKNLILDYPRDALAFFAPEEAPTPDDSVDIIPVRQEQLQERLGQHFRALDVPMLVEWSNGRREAILFVLEEETDRRRFSLHRLAHYCLDLAELFETDRVVPVTIFLRDAEAAPASLTLGTERRIYMMFDYLVCKLKEIPSERWQHSNNLVLCQAQIYGYLRVFLAPGLRCSSLCGTYHTASSRLARNQKSLAATLAFLDLTEH